MLIQIATLIVEMAIYDKMNRIWRIMLYLCLPSFLLLQHTTYACTFVIAKAALNVEIPYLFMYNLNSISIMSWLNFMEVR